MVRMTSSTPTGADCFKHVTETVLGLDANCGILRTLRREGYGSIGALCCLSPRKVALFEDVDVPILDWHKELVASVRVFRDSRRLVTTSEWMASTAEDYDDFGMSKEWKSLAVLIQEECALETPIVALTTVEPPMHCPCKTMPSPVVVGMAPCSA